MTENRLPTTGRVFTSQYVSDYERFSKQKPRVYEEAAARLGDLASAATGETILEIGSGTGNSTIVFGEKSRGFKRLIAIEPSAGFLDYAKIKFGKGGVHYPGEDLGDFLTEQKERARPFSNKVDLVGGRAEALPLVAESVDRVYLSQVIHWLAFADSDEKCSDATYLKASLLEMNRVLKQGGEMIFNTTGQQMDLTGELDTPNFIQPLEHPFYLLVAYRIIDQIRARGVDISIDPRTIKGKHYNVITPDFISRIFTESGFYIKNQFQMHQNPVSARHLIEMIKAGAQMNIFTADGLSDLREDQKGDLLNSAIKMCLEEHSELLNIPCSEVVVEYKAIKSRNPF